MTEAEHQPPSPRPTKSRPYWILWLIAGALVLGCACSVGALLLLRRAESVDWMDDLWPITVATATQPSAAPAATLTATQVPVQETPTISPTATATATTAATPTATATPTTTATATAATAPTPTPFVCDSLYELANIQLVPGQTFQCTIQEQELTDVANSYPESPCSEARFQFDDGEVDVECVIVLRMQATLVAKAENCRVEIEVVEGTTGFKQILQQLVATQFDVIKYDSICIDQVDADDGQVVVGGYGR